MRRERRRAAMALGEEAWTLEEIVASAGRGDVCCKIDINCFDKQNCHKDNIHFSPYIHLAHFFPRLILGSHNPVSYHISEHFTF